MSWLSKADNLLAYNEEPIILMSVSSVLIIASADPSTDIGRCKNSRGEARKGEVGMT